MSHKRWALSQAVCVSHENMHFLKQRNLGTISKKSETLRNPSNVPTLTAKRPDDPQWPSDDDDERNGRGNEKMVIKCKIKKKNCKQ